MRRSAQIAVLVPFPVDERPPVQVMDGVNAPDGPLEIESKSTADDPHGTPPP
jgi:hypothetical protein